MIKIHCLINIQMYYLQYLTAFGKLWLLSNNHGISIYYTKGLFVSFLIAERGVFAHHCVCADPDPPETRRGHVL